MDENLPIPIRRLGGFFGSLFVVGTAVTALWRSGTIDTAPKYASSIGSTTALQTAEVHSMASVIPVGTSPVPIQSTIQSTIPLHNITVCTQDTPVSTETTDSWNKTLNFFNDSLEDSNDTPLVTTSTSPLSKPRRQLVDAMSYTAEELHPLLDTPLVHLFTDRFAQWVSLLTGLWNFWSLISRLFKKQKNVKISAQDQRLQDSIQVLTQQCADSAAYGLKLKSLESILAAFMTEKDVINANMDVFKTDMSTLKTIIDTVMTEKDAIKADMSTLKTNTDTVMTEKNAIKANISTLKTKIDTVMVEKSAMKTNMDGFKSDMSSLRTKVDTVMTKKDAIKSNMDVYKTDISSLETNIDTVKTTVASINTATIASIKEVKKIEETCKAHVAILEKKVANMDVFKTDMSTLKTDIDTVKTTVASIDAATTTSIKEVKRIEETWKAQVAILDEKIANIGTEAYVDDIAVRVNTTATFMEKSRMLEECLRKGLQQDKKLKDMSRFLVGDHEIPAHFADLFGKWREDRFKIEESRQCVFQLFGIQHKEAYELVKLAAEENNHGRERVIPRYLYFTKELAESMGLPSPAPVNLTTIMAAVWQAIQANGHKPVLQMTGVLQGQPNVEKELKHFKGGSQQHNLLGGRSSSSQSPTPRFGAPKSPAYFPVNPPNIQSQFPVPHHMNVQLPVSQAPFVAPTTQYGTHQLLTPQSSFFGSPAPAQIPSVPAQVPASQSVKVMDSSNALVAKSPPASQADSSISSLTIASSDHTTEDKTSSKAKEDDDKNQKIERTKLMSQSKWASTGKETVECNKKEAQKMSEEAQKKEDDKNKETKRTQLMSQSKWASTGKEAVKCNKEKEKKGEEAQKEEDARKAAERAGLTEASKSPMIPEQFAQLKKDQEEKTANAKKEDVASGSNEEEEKKKKNAAAWAVMGNSLNAPTQEEYEKDKKEREKRYEELARRDKAREEARIKAWKEEDELEKQGGAKQRRKNHPGGKWRR